MKKKDYVILRDLKGKIIGRWPTPDKFSCIVCRKSMDKHPKEPCGRFGER